MKVVRGTDEWVRMNEANRHEEYKERRRAAEKRWRDNNPELRKRRDRQAYAKHKDRIVERANAWQLKNADKVIRTKRNHHLRKMFGITLLQWEVMFMKQGNVCAVCGSSDPGSIAGWHTDHDHGTSKVRGILCNPCNTTEGHIKKYLVNKDKWDRYLR